MRQKGMVHTIVLMLVLIFGLLIFFIARIKPNVSDSSTPVTVIPASPLPSATPTATPDPSLGKTYSFQLLKNEKYKYLLEWTGYLDNAYWETNMHAPVSIVKVDIATNKETVVKDNIFPLLSGDGTKGYFRIVAQPASTDMVMFYQGVEGTDGRITHFLNVASGALLNQTDVFGSDRFCPFVPFDRESQRVMVFSCLEDYSQDPFDAHKEVNNRLFTYDFKSGVRKQVFEIPLTETFGCDQGYDSWYKYKYISNSELEVSTCDTDLQTTGKKIVIY